VDALAQLLRKSIRVISSRGTTGPPLELMVHVKQVLCVAVSVC
jgi:hypothetical protein